MGNGVSSTVQFVQFVVPGTIVQLHSCTVVQHQLYLSTVPTVSTNCIYQLYLARCLACLAAWIREKESLTRI